MNQELPLVPLRRIEQAILVIRGQRVMLGSDLAELYGVSARRLNEQVKRNRDRFPDDFMFQLTSEEWRILKSQFATSSWGSAHRALPYATCSSRAGSPHLGDDERGAMNEEPLFALTLPSTSTSFPPSTSPADRRLDARSGPQESFIVSPELLECQAVRLPRRQRHHAEPGQL